MYVCSKACLAVRRLAGTGSSIEVRNPRRLLSIFGARLYKKCPSEDFEYLASKAEDGHAPFVFNSISKGAIIGSPNIESKYSIC